MERGAWWATVHGVRHGWASHSIRPACRSMTLQPPHLLKLNHFTYMPMYLYISVSTLSVSVISTSLLIPTPVLVAIPTLISPVGYCLSDGGGLVAKTCPTLATPWTVAHKAPLSIEFSRQEYWSGLPFPSPGDLPNQGSNLSLLNCWLILYWLSCQGSQFSDKSSIGRATKKLWPMIQSGDTFEDKAGGLLSHQIPLVSATWQEAVDPVGWILGRPGGIEYLTARGK